MATMSGQALLPSAGSRPPDQNPDDELFTGLVVSNPQKAKGRFGISFSVVAHVVIISSVILIPVFWPVDLPEIGDPYRVLIYNPPAAMAAPLPKGSSAVQKTDRPKPVTDEIQRQKPTLEVELDTPKEQPLKPEARDSALEQAGSETGSDAGIPEGMEGGQDGGVAGGVPWGQFGGCVGCTGDGPVLNFDQPPKPIKMTRPQYPNEAFVKKIEGTVVLEILIDATGRVFPVKIIQSIPALDHAARETVKQWVFSPAVKNGRAVATIAQAPVSFRIF